MLPDRFGRAADAVSGITYLYIGLGFGYLSLITDAYSKLIVAGPPVRLLSSPFLTAEGSLRALDMALSIHLEREDELIHHGAGRSDRGSQYCIFDYVRKLKGANILISMTHQGDVFLNGGRVGGKKLEKAFFAFNKPVQFNRSAF